MHPGFFLSKKSPSSVSDRFGGEVTLPRHESEFWSLRHLAEKLIVRRYVASGGISQGQALTQELRIGPNTKPGVYQTVGQLVSQPNGGVTKIPIRVEVK
jgi:hypothetical protein